MTLGLSTKLTPVLSNNAIKIIKKSPKWIPAKKNGVAVDAQSQVTVDYRLVGDSEASKEDIMPFALVEVKPKFQGDEANQFVVWVNSRIKYPEEAFKNNIEGTVLIGFIIDAEGNLKDIKSIRAVNQILIDEAIRVIKESPKWTPGKDKGKNVAVPYQVPIIFKMQGK